MGAPAPGGCSVSAPFQPMRRRRTEEPHISRNPFPALAAWSRNNELVEPSPYSFLRAVEIGPWAAQPSVESAGGVEGLPRWTDEGCAPAATSTTWPLCGTLPDCYWCRFEKQGHHTSLSHPLSTLLCPSGSSVRSTKPLLSDGCWSVSTIGQCRRCHRSFTHSCAALSGLRELCSLLDHFRPTLVRPTRPLYSLVSTDGAYEDRGGSIGGVIFDDKKGIAAFGFSVDERLLKFWKRREKKQRIGLLEILPVFDAKMVFADFLTDARLRVASSTMRVPVRT